MKIEDILMRNEQLILENEALRQQIQDLKNGFEGSCYACEPVGIMNKQLIKERDELRREICGYSYDDPRGVAKDRGWDCFKEFLKAHSDENLKTIERLQEENRKLRELKIRGVVSEPKKAIPPHYDNLQDLG